MLLVSILSISTADNSKAAVKKITLNAKKITLKIGEKKKLKAKTSLKVKWKSSSKKIATVNNKGLVKAKKTGTAKITAYARNYKSIQAICRVKVETKNKEEQKGNENPQVNTADPSRSQLDEKNGGTIILQDGFLIDRIIDADEKAYYVYLTRDDESELWKEGCSAYNHNYWKNVDKSIKYWRITVKKQDIVELDGIFKEGDRVHFYRPVGAKMYIEGDVYIIEDAVKYCLLGHGHMYVNSSDVHSSAIMPTK